MQSFLESYSQTVIRIWNPSVYLSENGHDSGEDNLSSSDNDDAAAGPNGMNATPGPGLDGRGQTTGRVRGGGRSGGHSHFELPCSNYSSLVVYFTIL